MSDFQSKLNEYAKLVVKVGINIQPGQPLVVNAPIEGVEFVRRYYAKNAYESGASEVYVNWSDEVITRLKYENAPIRSFENFPNCMLMA